MSQESEELSNEEEEEEDEEVEDDEEGDDDEEDEEDDQDEDEDDQDDQDQDEDQDEEDDDEEGSDQQGSQDGEEEDDESEKPVPAFGTPQFVETEEFKFRNLLAEISSLGSSTDNFINSLPSRGGSNYRSYQPRGEPLIPKTFDLNIPESAPEPIAKREVMIMKDEDTQVSMQPQIVVQQTLVPREEPKKQPYRISNESTKFLAQLYEENKKLKRWQNSQMGSQSNGFYKSKQKFQRPEHERGLINLDDRNRQIDQAIEMLRREDYQ